jgi:formic-like protein
MRFEKALFQYIFSLILAIMRRNIELSTDDVVLALNNFDMQVLAQDYVEVLLRIMPSEEEIKKYKEYDREKKPVDVLTDEDKFLLQVMNDMLTLF